MYPLLCAGGFPNPEKIGVQTIVGVQAIPVVAGSPMDVQLRDDTIGTAPASSTLNEIMHLKGDGNGAMQMTFDPPLKTRRGIRATTLTNATVLVDVR